MGEGTRRDAWEVDPELRPDLPLFVQPYTDDVNDPKPDPKKAKWRHEAFGVFQLLSRLFRCRKWWLPFTAALP